MRFRTPFSPYFPFYAHSECKCRRMCFTLCVRVFSALRRHICHSVAVVVAVARALAAITLVTSLCVFFGPTINLINAIMDSCFRFHFLRAALQACSQFDNVQVDSVASIKSGEQISTTQNGVAHTFSYRSFCFQELLCASSASLTLFSGIFNAV